MRPWQLRRHRTVTDEPFRVDPALPGRPLSSFRRRTEAFLLGFLEAVWDPNRQGLHDKVAGTVVLRGGADAE